MRFRTFMSRLVIGSTLLVLMLLANIFVLDWHTRGLYRVTQSLTHAYDVMGALDAVGASVIDAETGERGFLITGRDEYLQPYTQARRQIEGELQRLSGLVQNDPVQRAAVVVLEARIRDKLDQLAETITTYRNAGPSAASELVMTGRSKRAMDSVRSQLSRMRAYERDRLQAAAVQSRTRYQVATASGIITGTFGVLLALAFIWSVHRSAQQQEASEIALNHSLARERAWAERLRQVAAASLTLNAATSREVIAGVIEAESSRIIGAGRCKVVYGDSVVEEGEGSLVAVLKDRVGRQMGYIHCADKKSGPFDDDDRAALTLMAQVTAVALENSILYNEIRTSDLRKDEFLATLAHELRNPLAPIAASLEILRLTSDPMQVARSREVVERQLSQLVHLVDDLLDVARVSRGKLELRRRPVLLRQVLKAAVETSMPLIKSHRHELEVHQPSEDVWLDADLTRLSQVFANLLNNSAKYTEPGGRIVIDASASVKDAVVRVRDSGIGMSAEMLPHVFDMFVQSERAINRSQGGLGIGLTLVRRLVELHDGTVSASSAGPGKGSDFTVRLPRLAAGSTDAPSAAAPALTELPARRVLVVDDNQDAADSLTMLLSVVGQIVASARDGVQALKLIDEFAPDVIILDLGLPGLSGYEVARRVRAMPQRERVVLVALTGWGQDEDRRRTLEAGFDHHLVKPVDFEVLKALLAQLPTGRGL